MLLRRRRRAGLALGVSVGLAGCGDGGGSDAAGTSGEASTSSSATTVAADSVDTSGGSTVAGGETTTAASSGEREESETDTTGAVIEPCELGTLECGCAEDFTCGLDLRCELDTCIACPGGTETCHCVLTDDAGRDGVCDPGLICVNSLCASPPPCPFVENGTCDEPDIGTGACFEGSDAFDCCATQPGVCEEISAGGRCPDGSDPEDCAPAGR